MSKEETAMKAVITRPYACAPEGHTVVKFEPGAEVSGAVAEMALADNAALEIRLVDPFETKVVSPPEAKAPAKKKTKKG